MSDTILETGRQSLVTPIDWKLEPIVERGLGVVVGRQSLVTPIEWKHTES